MPRLRCDFATRWKPVQDNDVQIRWEKTCKCKNGDGSSPKRQELTPGELACVGTPLCPLCEAEYEQTGVFVKK